MDTAPGTDLPTRVPDVRDQPFGGQDEQGASATAAIRRQVLRKKSAEVPVAAFQSSI